MPATCPTHPNILHLMSLDTSALKYKVWRSFLYNSLHVALNFSPLLSLASLNTLFSATTSISVFCVQMVTTFILHGVNTFNNTAHHSQHRQITVSTVFTVMPRENNRPWTEQLNARLKYSIVSISWQIKSLFIAVEDVRILTDLSAFPSILVPRY